MALQRFEAEIDLELAKVSALARSGMAIHQSHTKIAQKDPLKKGFERLFSTLPLSARGHVVAVLGEFIGTVFFIFFAFGGAQVGSASSNNNQGSNVSTATAIKSPQQLLYIALSAGFSLAVFGWTFFRISGGLFNPAVSFGMALIGAITWARCLLLCIAQFIGTIIAAYVVDALFHGGLNVSTELGGGTSAAQGVIIEMFLTSQLCFTIFMLAAEQHAGKFLAPVGIGLSLFIAELVGVFWTRGSLNPARSLAPCIVNRSFTSYHWIYWIGPITGTIFAVLMYKLVKALEYETVNSKKKSDHQGIPGPTSATKQPSSIIALKDISINDNESTVLPPIGLPASQIPLPTSREDDHHVNGQEDARTHYPVHQEGR